MDTRLTWRSLIGSVGWLVALGSSATSSLAAQARWQRQATVTCRTAAVIAYDSHRQRVVVYGNDNFEPLQATWEFDGTTWREIPTTTQPAPQLLLGGMSYDSTRRRMVMVGVLPGQQPQTWEFDGRGWTRHANAPLLGTPAFDEVRQRTVLAGFDSTSTVLGTWEWDGSTWSLRATMSNRNVPIRLVRDPRRGRIVTLTYDLLGQLTTGEWDGTQWTWFAAAPTPPYRNPRSSAMAWDAASGKVVLFGGETQSHVLLDDTWAWDGTTWTRHTGSLAPSPRQQAAMCGDDARGRLVLVGGDDYTMALPDVWQFDATGWQRTVLEGGPPRTRASLAFDPIRGHSVLFGGAAPGNVLSDQTWTFDGRSWTRQLPVVTPPARRDAAMTFDSARGVVVLFGGDSGTLLADHWEWDGVNWRQIQFGAGPAARAGHALTYDARRNRLVLFGGATQAGAQSDTWEWDGTAWSLRRTGFPPPSRQAAMAFDPRRGRSVLVIDGLGGSSAWEWDGQAWFSTNPAVRPPNFGALLRLAYDSARERLVVVGPGTTQGPAATWEWDGTTWAPRGESLLPRRFPEGYTMTYDSVRERVVYYGGSWQAGTTYEWFFGSAVEWFTDQPARVRSFGAACGGVAALPQLTVDGRPWLGDRARFVRHELPAAAAHVLVLGGSDQTWLGQTLPLSLAPLGHASCALSVAADLAIAVASTGNLDVLVPTESALIGARIYCQVFAGEVASGRLHTTNAIELQVGVR